MTERYADGAPASAIALVMEKHGLAVWGVTPRECYENLRAIIEKAEAFVAERAKGKRAFGVPAAPALDDGARREVAAAILPAIRGELARRGWRCVLHLDDSPETIEAIAGEEFPEVAARGVMTPEHILRAGVRPLVVHGNGVDVQHVDRIRDAIRTHRDEYAAYAKHHGHDPIPDFLKTIIVPGIGIIYAGKGRRSALVAADCYRATMQVMANAEAIERFEFASEADQAEVEYWPLERRKIEASEKSRRELDGKIALVIGAASGIGRAAALGFAEAD